MTGSLSDADVMNENHFTSLRVKGSKGFFTRNEVSS
jgi:hypothetical protein